MTSPFVDRSRDSLRAAWLVWGAASGACAAALWGLIEGSAYLAIEVKLKGLYVSESMGLWQVLRHLADPGVVAAAVVLYASVGLIAGTILGGVAGSIAARRGPVIPPPSTLMPAIAASLMALAVCDWNLFQRRWGGRLLGLALVPLMAGAARAGELVLRRLGREPWARPARRVAAAAMGVLILAAFFLALAPLDDAVERSATPLREPRAASAALGPRRPHIVLVVLDTARADRFSAYGAARPTTPEIDALARQGVLFESAFAVAPWTLPSHASLFSGLYPTEHECDWGRQRLRPDVLTLAEVLRRAGYRTAAFTNSPWIGPFTGLDRGFEEVFPLWRRSTGSVERLAVVRALRRLTGRYADEGAGRTNRLFARWLGPALDEGAPLFLFFNYLELHDPNWPAPEARRWMGDTVPAGRLDRLNQNPYKYLAGVGRMGPEDFRLLADLYDAELTYLDHRIGELARILRAHGLWDDTLFVLTGDHGENLGDHELMSHVFSLADTLLHVPLILRYPARLPAGLRARSPVELIDVAPTALEAAGLPPDSFGRPLSGKSLFGSLGPGEDAADGGRVTFAENYRPRPIIEILRMMNPAVETARFDRGLRSARQGRWKYVWWTDGQESLYDLAADPAEDRDVLADRRDVAERLAGVLVERLGPMGVREDKGEIADPEARERLRALGYVK